LHYQKLLKPDESYIIQEFPTCSFRLHRHYEIEIIYFLSGKGYLSIERKNYILESGSLAVISSTSSHQASCDPDTKVLLLKINPTLLGQPFTQLSEAYKNEPILKITDEKLLALLRDLRSDCQGASGVSKLKTTAGIYALSALLLEAKSNFSVENGSVTTTEKKMEDVFDFVSKNYPSKITVETAAEIVGYSVGNFCRLFKRTTGMSFHTYLNDYRIKKAKSLLRETKLPVHNIAIEVGFSESKTLCRIFKERVGLTPTAYREGTSDLEIK
jgi:AraC-like DNA-binding protein